MKNTLILCTCLFALLSQAQTAIIAHKSHAGTSADFFIDPSSNFGDPGPRLIQVVRLNDSTYVHVMSEFSGFIYHDTVRYTINLKQNIDSVYEEKKSYVELINFQSSHDSVKVKRPSQQTRYEELNIQPQQEAAPKKKKKSYLLFLFGITGGGLLVFRGIHKLVVPQIIS